MLQWREQVAEHHWAAFTDVDAGNLALHVGDDPAVVAANRSRLEQELGLATGELRFMHQVHSATAALTEPALVTPAPVADALVCADGAASVAVMVADCVPILLFGNCSDGTPVSAAAHAGRQGLLDGIIAATVSLMRAQGATNLHAWIGPAICGQCYEVPLSLQQQVATAVPGTLVQTRWGTPGLDLPAGAAAQLGALDVGCRRVGGCTYEDERLFSYRRDGTTGRFAGVLINDLRG